MAPLHPRAEEESSPNRCVRRKRYLHTRTYRVHGISLFLLICLHFGGLINVSSFQARIPLQKPATNTHHLPPQTSPSISSKTTCTKPSRCTPPPQHTTTTSTSLAGIKGFRGWFESQFPKAMSTIPRTSAQEKFDHVLIDMNQLLHVCLRKSRSEGHALTLLMKELDDCCRMATPTKSLVLAMDGPPSASKLATQRQRRLNTIVRNERKLQQIDQLSSTGKRVFSQAKQNRKRRRYETETQTLRITPGTEFMQLTERAVLYWAWQRFQTNNPHHYLSRVKVYISPSTVAGEGEVKLLEWVLRQQVVSKKDSIAILGGDSDLVLEGLVIPPSFSHNVFVLLPDGNRKYLSVSLWETTRALYRFLPKDLPSEQVLRVRTDLVLLLILNGNDYFPKLRGSSGFHKVFHTYLKTLRDWLAKEDPELHPPFLVEPESLTYNLPFCIAFFRHLEKLAPPNLLWRTKTGANDRAIRAATPLARFNSLVDAGFFPKPIKWKSVEVEDEDGNIVEGEDDEEEEEEEDGQEDDDEDALLDLDSEDEEDDDDDDDDEDPDGDDESEEDGVAERQTLVKLRIGRPRTEDYACYEIWQPKRKTLKRAKHKLASMALEDLFGDIGDYFDNEKEETVNSYPWDIKHPVDGDPSIYLGGLLWNLQTYQDGTCADYAFNYGKRMAPTASEIVTFLEEARGNNTELGLKQLMKNCTTGSPESYPFTAGVSCLAALPGQVRELVPEPYRHLSVEAVEEVYGECMDPNNNVFEYKKFERMCDELVEELGYVKGSNSSPGLSPEQAMDQANFWIVLSKSRTPLAKPIDPPPPFSDRLSQLRPNNRIRVNRVKAVWQRRQRAIWDADETDEGKQRSPAKLSSRAKWEEKKLNQAQPDRFLSKFEYLDEVGYKRAYRKDKKKSSGKSKAKLSALEASLNGSSGKERKKKKRKSASVTEQMLSQGAKKPPPKKYVTTADGQSAIACLKQFQDAEMIGPYEWKSIMPSTSSYASFSPEDHELVSLTVPVGSNPDLNILKEVLFYEQDRDVNHVSKQALKQHLATFALSDIVGPNVKWTEFTYKDLRAMIGAKNKVGNK